MQKTRLPLKETGDPIRPMSHHRDGLMSRLIRDSEAEDFDQVEAYEDPTIGTNRPSERGGLMITRENIERIKDILIIRFHELRVPFSLIADILGMSKSGVYDRFHSIPEDVRRHYARVKLG